MLWNNIFEFYVKYIFGGSLDGLNFYQGILGYNYNTGGASIGYTGYFASQVQVGDYQLTFGNYLSLLATIITIVIIVVLCWLFVYKIIKLIGGLIR